MREKSFERNFYITDHLGTVRVEMDAMGNVISTHDFEPFGVELPPSGDPQSKLLYTGQERDSLTNYDYMHFTYYSSSIGRFLKPDNIIPDITNPQNWNAYSYVKGNPVNYNDPSGHDNPDPIEQSVKVNTSTGNAPTSNASAPPPNDSQNLEMKTKLAEPKKVGDELKQPVPPEVEAAAKEVRQKQQQKGVEFTIIVAYDTEGKVHTTKAYPGKKKGEANFKDAVREMLTEKVKGNLTFEKVYAIHSHPEESHPTWKADYDALKASENGVEKWLPAKEVVGVVAAPEHMYIYHSEEAWDEYKRIPYSD